MDNRLTRKCSYLLGRLREFPREHMIFVRHTYPNHLPWSLCSRQNGIKPGFKEREHGAQGIHACSLIVSTAPNTKVSLNIHSKSVEWVVSSHSAELETFLFQCFQTIWVQFPRRQCFSRNWFYFQYLELYGFKSLVSQLLAVIHSRN